MKANPNTESFGSLGRLMNHMFFHSWHRLIDEKVFHYNFLPLLEFWQIKFFSCSANKAREKKFVGKCGLSVAPDDRPKELPASTAT